MVGHFGNSEVPHIRRVSPFGCLGTKTVGVVPPSPLDTLTSAPHADSLAVVVARSTPLWSGSSSSLKTPLVSSWICGSTCTSSLGYEKESPIHLRSQKRCTGRRGNSGVTASFITVTPFLLHLLLDILSGCHNRDSSSVDIRLMQYKS